MSVPSSPDPGASQESARPLFLVVRIKPRRDKLAEAHAQLLKMRDRSREDPGCVFMHLVEGVDDDSDTWLMIEQFRSRAAWDDHMASEYNRSGNAALDPLLREPSDLQLFHET